MALEEPVRADKLGGIDFSELEPVAAPPRLSDTIAERIRDFIIGQNLAEGTRLPSERALAERLGTSRPTVSQAIRTLALMGLVESRRGSGAYVLRRPDKAEGTQGRSLLSPTADNLEHLVELRLWLENLAIQQAIDRSTDTGLREARRALARLADSVGETSTWIAADTVFHATLVELAANPVLTALYEQVHTSLLEYEYQHWVENDRVPRWLAPSQAEAQLALHAPIVEALERADPEAALIAVRRHNDVMREHLLSREE
ncbi:FadR/GntR family transcriptional regulator [Parafrankia sp. BMG5.11]|uniref:FadR/GntR family transcriptional regulator n=1 Tax=Parafrankia sp. BMG5.11 TaxID=222540 RepID=UPI00103FAABB|nr:FCD domain-containing protein [Parafrankia sp. BMG5.11]TCJ38080.1 FadR family transcriptional regulator [Parafrankia sp. BMG5.11]